MIHDFQRVVRELMKKKLNSRIFSLLGARDFGLFEIDGGVRLKASMRRIDIAFAIGHQECVKRFCSARILLAKLCFHCSRSSTRENLIGIDMIFPITTISEIAKSLMMRLLFNLRREFCCRSCIYTLIIQKTVKVPFGKGLRNDFFPCKSFRGVISIFPLRWSLTKFSSRFDKFSTYSTRSSIICISCPFTQTIRITRKMMIVCFFLKLFRK